MSRPPREGGAGGESQSSVAMAWLRAGARTGMIMLGVGLILYPFLPGFCSVTDTSDTGGGALGCALTTIMLLYVGQISIIVGSLVPQERETKLPLLPGLSQKQRRLIVAALLIQAVAIVVGLVGTPFIDLVGLQVWIPAYLVGWALIVAAWGWLIVGVLKRSD